ncbi:Heat shock protein beta-7 [Dissostichus eleginoides]|uniref:Heat shock protein beta-7 n=1 Tax=Dissostichus eleginoides TaxID=100907 RepID=A0AAD9F5G1_DISEL|nr:Heat shock protein beta-7 [Dissostichus eleginoides]
MEALSRPIETTTGHSYPTGKIQVMGDLFQFILDVSGFSPEDVVITTSNNRIKVEEDGAVTAVTHFLPSMQTAIECGPQISVTMSMESSGALTVRAHRLLSSPPCV